MFDGNFFDDMLLKEFKELKEARRKEHQCDSNIQTQTRNLISDITELLFSCFSDTMTYMGDKLKEPEEMTKEDVMFATKVMVRSIKLQELMSKIDQMEEGK